MDFDDNCSIVKALFYLPLRYRYRDKRHVEFRRITIVDKASNIFPHSDTRDQILSYSLNASEQISQLVEISDQHSLIFWPHRIR